MSGTATSAAARPLLMATSVSRRFRAPGGIVTAVADASLSLTQGEVVGLVGASGSGKSTLLHLLIGWDRPDEGEVRRDASVVEDWGGLAVVPQHLGLLDALTVWENIEIAGRLAGLQPDPAHVRRVIDRLGLTALIDRHPHAMSLGEQQRVSVTRAVAGRPRVLVADEPTAHQDEARALAVMAELRVVAAAGGAVLVATHDTRLLGDVDRVLRMSDGQLTTG